MLFIRLGNLKLEVNSFVQYLASTSSASKNKVVRSFLKILKNDYSSTRQIHMIIRERHYLFWKLLMRLQGIININ